jgi:cyclophilin family peptidyl-prolyl cis-trans isomerase
MTQKETAPPIKNEANNGLKNKKYTLAMARTGVVDSATSQFFINTVNNTGLDHRDTTRAGYGYCVFGKVIEGTEVIDKIEMVQTTTKGAYGDVPVKPVIIKAMTLMTEEE